MTTKAFKLTTLALAFVCMSAAHAATEWNAQDYDLYPGDFNGDSKTDILYIAKDPSKSSGITLSDGTAPNIAWQSWPSNHLGIQWYGGRYVAVVGDFNNDNKSDVLMQNSAIPVPGDSFLLLADPAGRLTGISQTIGNSHLGIGWSQDQHAILAGDFDGDGRDDLFLQATSPSGTNAVVLAAASGMFINAPTQAFTDASWGAFKWSTKNSVIHVGYFNGDGRADLLIQAKPKIVMIKYDIPIPVAVYTPNTFGVVYSQGGSTPLQQVGVQQWSRYHIGVDWSPNSSRPVISDFNGDGRSDVLLIGRGAGSANYLLYGNASGSAFASPTVVTSNVPTDAGAARIIAGNFSGGAVAGLYIQATTPTGTNYSTTSVGASISAAVHNTANATGVVHPTTAVGVTPGSFDVDRMGAAVYRVPIKVPPGVKGIQPSLSLTYSSHTGNGLLGVGWSLSGLSQISLCQASYGQDGYDSAITYDSEGNRLCLDGARLHQTNGEAYGEFPYFKAGATYDTEKMSFARIVNHGTGSDPAAHLTMHRKDGLEYEYGSTPDSRIEPVNKVKPYAWLLSRVKDRSGNVMTFEYEEDGWPNGSYRPKRIYYTSNASAGIAAAYEVKFVWEVRPESDHIFQYTFGTLVRETKRLRRIETYYAGGLVKKYEIGYAQSSTYRSRLVAVQECSGSGACLAPTTFTWQDGTASWASEQTIAVTPYGSSLVLPSASMAIDARSADYDGDGYTDLLYHYPPQSNQYGPYSTWGMLRSNGSTLTYSGDIGMVPDLVFLGSIVGRGPTNRPITTIPATPLKWWIGDVDADGIADSVRYDGQFFVKRGPQNSPWMNGVFIGEPLAVSGVASLAPMPGGTVTSDSGFRDAYANQSQTEVGQLPDFNGDSKTDFLVDRNVTVQFPSGLVTWRLSAVLVSNGSGYQMTTLSSKYFCSSGGLAAPCAVAGSTASLVDVGILAADFNGDGFTDVLNKDLQANLWQVFWGSGLGLTAPQNVDLPTTLPNVVAHDFTADGRSDLMYSASVSGGVWKLTRWTGVRFELVTNNAVPDNAQYLRLMDINGDGLKDVGYLRDGAYRVRLHQGPAFDLLKSITDGFQNEIEVSYVAPMDSSVYFTPLPGPAVDELDFHIASPNVVVKSHRVSDGAGGNYSIDQRYGDVKGRLGFGLREERDSRTGLVQHTDYLRRSPRDALPINMPFPYTGLPTKKWVTQTDGTANGTLVSETTYQYTKVKVGLDWENVDDWYYYPTVENGGHTARFHVYANEVVNRSYEVGGVRNGVLLSETKSTANAMDEYGNATDVTTVVDDKDTLLPASDRRFTTRVVQSIANDNVNWCLGRSSKTQTVTTLGNLSSRTQYSARTIDNQKCRVTDEVTNSNSSGQPTALSVSTHYDFATAVCGNPSTITVTGRRSNGTALPSRSTSFEYATCVAATKVTDALGNWSQRTYDYRFGALKTGTDPNGLTVTMEYDTFGRRTKEIRPDGTSTTVDITACDLSNNHCGVADLRVRVDTTARNTAGAAITNSYSYADSLGRVRIQASPLPLTGELSHVVRTYDSRGQLATMTVPYATGVPARTEYEYDLVGREVSVKLYDSGETLKRKSSARYEGRKRIFKDPRDFETEKVFDALGQLRTVKDHGSPFLTRYDYTFINDNLVSTVTDKLGSPLVSIVNLAGHKVRSEDPDMGVWTFEYNSFGELAKQTDAKGQEVTFADYDALGRPTLRHEAEGNTTFDYATPSQHAYPQLSAIASGGYSEIYSFDALGRQVGSATTIPGDSIYNLGYSYDSTTGQLDTMTYPASTGTNPLKVKYGYTKGVQTSVRDYTNNTLGTTYWQLTAMDAMGNSTQEQLGNGMRVITGFDPVTGLMSSRQSGTDSVANNQQNLSYQWDASGNFKRRTDNNQAGLFEEFHYDELNRLDYSTRNGSMNLDLQYNEIGNITQRTSPFDVSQVWTYNYTAQQAGCSYGGHPSRPHAVRNVAGASYCYDKNGNMTNRGSATIDWYSDNTVKKVTQGSVSSEFWYSPSGARYKQHAVYSTGSETTYYVGGAMEKVVIAGSSTAYRHYIAAGSNFAIHTRWSTGTTQTLYATTDQLGSSSSITNESGALVVAESFDAFGKRRGTNWTGSPTSAEMQVIANATRQGYTGHEHLDNIGLIHMNGRVQDPNIGRFLSADPTIQAPGFSQSLNRYSYVWNNPLTMFDPSGFDGKPVCRDTGMPSEIDCVEVVGRFFEDELPCPSGGDDCLKGWEARDWWRDNVNRADQDDRPSLTVTEAREASLREMAELQRILNTPLPESNVQSEPFVLSAINFVDAASWLFPPAKGEIKLVTISLKKAITDRLALRAAERQLAARGGATAFHHTADGFVKSIMQGGLRPGSYATPKVLSPLQAKIELALPGNLPRNAVLEIDLAGLRKAGYQIPDATRVSSYQGLAGGGYEMQFPYAIPPEFLRVIQ